MVKSTSRRPSAPNGDTNTRRDPSPPPEAPRRFTRRSILDNTRTLLPCLREAFNATDTSTWQLLWRDHLRPECVHPMDTTDVALHWLAFNHWPVVGYSFHVYTGQPRQPICDRVIQALEPFEALTNSLRQLAPPENLSEWTAKCIERTSQSGLVLNPAVPTPQPPAPQRRGRRARASQSPSQASSQSSAKSPRSPTSHPPPKRSRRQPASRDPTSTGKTQPDNPPPDDRPTQREELHTTPHDAYFDGAAPGNCQSADPLPGGAGFVIYSADHPHTELLTGSEPVPGPCTNNVAEFLGLIHLLDAARRLDIDHLRVHGDSKLVVNVMNGSICLRKPRLLQLYLQAKSLREGFTVIEFLHVRRNLNSKADRLANTAAQTAQQAARRAPAAPILHATPDQAITHLGKALGQRQAGKTFGNPTAVKRFLFSRLRHVRLATPDWDPGARLAQWVYRELFSPTRARASSPSTKVHLSTAEFPAWWTDTCNEIFAKRPPDLPTQQASPVKQPRPRLRSVVVVPPPSQPCPEPAPSPRDRNHQPPRQQTRQQDRRRQQTAHREQLRREHQQSQREQPDNPRRSTQQPPSDREPTRILVLTAWPAEVPTSTDAALLRDLTAHGLRIHPATEVVRGGPGGQLALWFPTEDAAATALHDKHRCLKDSQYWLLPLRQHSNTPADRKAWVAAFRRHSGDEWGGPQAP